MCIFSGPVVNVDSTKIFARRDGNRQYIVYGMNVKTPKDNAMILPIPADRRTSKESVEFVNLSDCPDLLEAMSMIAHLPLPISRGLKMKGLPDEIIKVHEVGSYIASFVPTVQDFTRLAPGFGLPIPIWQRLGYMDSSFVVFKLKSGEMRVHPMAFSFASNTDRLFFPTTHVHDGKVHNEEKFDHTLFVQDSDIEFDLTTSRSLKWHLGSETPNAAAARQYFLPETAKKARQLRIAVEKGVLLGDRRLWVAELKGRLRNQDIWLDPLEPVHA